MPTNRPSIIQTPSESLTLFPRPPLFRSGPGQWKNIGLVHLRQPAYETPEVYLSWHNLMIFQNAASGKLTIDGTSRQQSIVPGDIMMIPACIGQGGSWNSELEMINIVISPLLIDAINDDVTFSSTELVPCFATPDPLVHQLGLSLKAILEQGSAGSHLYVETTAAMLAVHLLQHYSQRKLEFKDHTDGFSQSTLRQVIEYIDAHLDQELGLAELAAIAHLSPYYFTRLFKQSTGMSPHQFVIRYRVERAKTLLLAGKNSIAEIAHQVGFANQAHLTVHVKRLLGVTPKMILNQRKNR